MKKTIGYILLVLSFVFWAVIALLPFLDLSNGQIAGATTVLIIVAELAFFVSIALLGKEVWGRIKAKFKPGRIKLPNKDIWEEYPEVLHYTNFRTTLLILDSARLRATRFDLLEDTQEIIYAKHIIEEKLHENLPENTIEDVKADLNKLHEVLGSEFYITSFCGENSDIHRDSGLLSMWRNYGADGGCAIAFKTQNIFKKSIGKWKSLEIPPACVMDKVIYKGENDNDESYQKKLNRFVSDASVLFANPDEWSLDKTPKIVEDHLNLLICSKQPSLFEEREVRIGLCFNGKQAEIDSFSQKQFHEIPFAPAQDISRIIIGPHKDQKGRIEFLKSYLSQKKLGIEVTASEIPLRF